MAPSPTSDGQTGSTPQVHSQIVPLGQKLAYSSLTFGTSIPNAIAGGAAFFYMTQVVGLDPLIMGALQILPTFWDGFIDPFLGVISDRAQTRWGRRRPFILVGGILTNIGIILGWVIPPIYVPWAEVNNHSMVWIYLFILFMSFFDRTVQSVQQVPYLALGGEMSDLPDERNKLAAARSIGAQVGKIIGLTAGKWIIDILGIHYYPHLVLGLLVFAFIGVIIPAVYCRERRFTGAKSRMALMSFADMVKLLAFRPYLIFVIAFLITSLGFAFSSQFLIFVGRFWLLDNGAVFIFQIYAFITTLATLLFFWPWALRRFGAKNVMIFMFLMMSAGFGAAYFVVTPYDGDPLFTNRKIESLPKRLAYKAMTWRLWYTGADIEEIAALKAEVKKNPALGPHYFADMDPAGEADAGFVARLNDVISDPGLYDAVRDDPALTAGSFKDYGRFAEAAGDPASIARAFLGGDSIASPPSPETIALLNGKLAAPSFYDSIRDRKDMPKLPKPANLARQATIAPRLKTQLRQWALAGSEAFDLAAFDYSEAQMKELFAIMDIKGGMDKPTAHETVKRAFGLDSDPAVLRRKARARLVKELRSAFRLPTWKESIYLESPNNAAPLAIQPEEAEALRRFNRALLEAAYPEAVRPGVGLNMDAAPDKLMLMLVRTRETRQRPFAQLSGDEARDIRTTNRLLLSHLFPKRIHDAVPTVALAKLCILALLLGALNGALTIMPGVCLPDIADADEALTGQRRMAIFFGVESFAMKLFTMVVPPIKGLVLAAIGARDKIDLSATPEQLAGIVSGVRIAWAFPSAVATLLAVFVLFFYPLNNARLKRLRAELDAQRSREEAAEAGPYDERV